MADIITLNVGGQIYTTTTSTLTSYPDSMLGSMFSGKISSALDKHGNYFIDRDGAVFQHVLNFLRTSRLVLPTNFVDFELLGVEADFYQIQDLIEAVAKRLKEPDKDIVVIEKKMLREYDDGYYQDGDVLFSDWNISGRQQDLVHLADYFIKENSEEHDLCNDAIEFGSNKLRVKTYQYITDEYDPYQYLKSNKIYDRFRNEINSHEVYIFEHLKYKLWNLGYYLYDTKKGHFTYDGIDQNIKDLVHDGDTYYFKVA